MPLVPVRPRRQTPSDDFITNAPLPGGIRPRGPVDIRTGRSASPLGGVPPDAVTDAQLPGGILPRDGSVVIGRRQVPPTETPTDLGQSPMELPTSGTWRDRIQTAGPELTQASRAVPLTPQQGEARGRALSTLAKYPSTVGFGAAQAPTRGTPQEAQAEAQRNERLRAEAEAERSRAEAAAIAERERRAEAQFEEERRRTKLQEVIEEAERRRLAEERRRFEGLTEAEWRRVQREIEARREGGVPVARPAANPYASLPDDEVQRLLGAAQAGTFRPAEGVLEQLQERELRGFRAKSDIEREATEQLARQGGQQALAMLERTGSQRRGELELGGAQELAQLGLVGQQRRGELELGGQQELAQLGLTGQQRRGELELGGQQALEQLSRRGQLDIEGLRERGRLESEAEARQFERILPLLGPLIGGGGGGGQPGIEGGLIPSPGDRRAALARGAAFGRAKEQVGDITQGALRALESQLAEQGFTEAPMGAGEAAARAQVLAGGARGLTDVSRAQAIEEERRAQEVEDREAAALLERRAQDIAEMGQRRAIAPALLALMGRRLF